MSGVEGDNIETLNTITGAIYQIDDTSNLSLSIGTSSSEQNRGTADENDTNTFSSSYSKFFEKILLVLHIRLLTLIPEELQILLQTI